jgi:hypothetical protein
MLVGEGVGASESLASLPVIAAWQREPIVLTDVRCVQAIVELRRRDRAALLPPGLHPTDPPTLSIQGWRVAESPWGAFTAVSTRLSCRSGLRARGLTTAMVVSSPAAAAGLAEWVGFPARFGEVRVRVHYDACDIEVDDSLRLRGTDAQRLDVDDVQYTGTMNLAATPNGVRLVQVESEHDAQSVLRLRGRLEHFVAASWGDARLAPYDVVAVTAATDRVLTIPPVRFVCRPDVSAFEGTERIG